MTPKNGDAKPVAYQAPHVSTIGRVEELSLLAMEKLSDTQLMEALVAGHGNVMEVLFDRYHGLTLRIASNVLRNQGEAEDVTQEVFFRVYRKARLFNPSKGSFKVWLLSLVYHQSFDRRTSLIHRECRDKDSAAMQEQISLVRDGFAALAEKERLSIICRAMERLTERQRQTLQLVIFEGLTLKEITERLNESPVRVNHYYFRGLKKLRSVVHELLYNQNGGKNDSKV